MKSFIKEFLINLMMGLIGLSTISIVIGVIILIMVYVPEGVLQLVLLLLYVIIVASLFITIIDRGDRKDINKIL
jgi:hypothetical protein